MHKMLKLFCKNAYGGNTMTLTETPSAGRTHIAFFGRRNAGKSSLMNAVANRQISVVSDVK